MNEFDAFYNGMLIVLIVAFVGTMVIGAIIDHVQSKAKKNRKRGK